MCKQEVNVRTMNAEQHKDSCKYAVEIARQFLTLASAGVAFIVGLLMTGGNTAGQTYYLPAALFIASVVFGLIFTMSVVAHINQCNNYDVYTGLLKLLAGLQIVCFIAAMILVTIAVLNTIKHRDIVSPDDPGVSTVIDGQQITHVCPDGGTTIISLTGDGELVIVIQPEVDSDNEVTPTQ